MTPADLQLERVRRALDAARGDDLAALVGQLRARLAYLEDGRSPDSTAQVVAYALMLCVGGLVGGALGLLLGYLVWGGR